MIPNEQLNIFNDNISRDFYTEVQKSSFHLRIDFTARRLALYELYKKSIDIPGSVIELGIRHGASYYYLAQMIELFNYGMRPPSHCNRHLYGFDTLEGFPSISTNDRSKHEWKEMQIGGVKANKELVLKEFEEFKKSRSRISDRLHLVVGDAMKTLPKFVEENPGLKISFLYFDFDLYEPTLLGLQLLYPLVAPGGVIMFDEYGFVDFPGETKAVDEFFKGKENIKINTFPWAYCPSAYMIKNEY